MKKVSVGIIGLSLLLFVSCATSVDYTVIRPADLDLNGANSISVLPFKPSRRADIHIKPPKRGEKKDIFDYFYSYLELKSEEAEVIDYINHQLVSGLSKSKYLNLVDSKEVESALRRGTANQIVDVYLTGEIIHMDIEDERVFNKKTVEIEDTKKPVKDPSGPKPVSPGPTDGKKPDSIGVEKTTEIITENKFKRNVYLNYLYEIIDADTDQVVSYKQIEIKKSSSEYSNPKNLPDAFDIIESDLESDMKKLLKAVQPYSLDRSLYLLENKKEKDTMKVGENLVKVGNLDAAYDYFNKIYEKRGMFEAGYNAALILEAEGKLKEADELMTEVYLGAESKKQSRKAKSALDDIRNEIKYDKKLKGQLQDQIERSEEK